MSNQPRNPDLAVTTRILDRSTPRRFSADPDAAVTAYAPPSEDLVALSARVFPDSRDIAADPESGRRRTLPPEAPDWMHAARSMSDALESMIAHGVDRKDHAAIERMWAAWTFGGTTPRQALKVAHLVRRAHTAIRETQRDELEIAYRDCAEVLYGGLPSGIRQSMPFERALIVVRALRQEVDPWHAVVEGSAELLGWKDYARMFAASFLRVVIEDTG